MRHHGFFLFLAAFVGLVALGLVAARVARTPRPARVTGSVALETRNGRLAVTADHAGEPLRLILDTGAERSAITGRALRRLGAPLRGQTRLLGAGGERMVPVAELGPLRIGRLQVDRLAVLVLETGALGGYDGILGLDVLRRTSLRIDVPAGRLEFGATATGAGLPLRDVGSGIVAVDVDVDGATAAAILDTGLPRTLLNPEAALAAGVIGRAAGQALGLDGNRIRAAVDTVARLAAGGEVLLDRGEVGIADAPLFAAAGLAGRPALLLGADAFQPCAIVIDWSALRFFPCVR